MEGVLTDREVLGARLMGVLGRSTTTDVFLTLVELIEKVEVVTQEQKDNALVWVTDKLLQLEDAKLVAHYQIMTRK